MIKYSIKNNINGRTFESSFPSRESGDAWKNEQIVNDSWGLPERLKSEFDCSEEEKSLAIDIVEIESNMFYKLPCEYSITIEDVSSQFELEQQKILRIAEGSKARKCCEEILDYIAGYNVERSLSLSDIQAMMGSCASVLSYLKNNMPRTVKDELAKVPAGSLVTQDLKDHVSEILSKNGY